MVVRPHDVAIIASQGAHLNCLRNVVVVPAAHRHIRECRDVGALVGAVKPVNHSCHLCPGEKTVWRHRVFTGSRHDSIFDSPIQGVIRPVAIDILKVSDVGGEGADGKRVDHQHPCKKQGPAPSQFGMDLKAHISVLLNPPCFVFLPLIYTLRLAFLWACLDIMYYAIYPLTLQNPLQRGSHGNPLCERWEQAATCFVI